MGNGIFYRGKLVATEQSRKIEGSVKEGYQTVYVFEGVEALKSVMKASKKSFVQFGSWNPQDTAGKVPIPQFMKMLDQSLAIYPSLESQIANENRPISMGERGRCGITRV
jgi:hypothetical protein